MPSTLSSQEPQRSWWSLSQKSPSSSQVFPEKPHSHSKQSGIKFNTLATAMGFKPKKPHPPPLTLHDVRTVVTPPPTHLAPRTDAGQRRPYTAPSSAVVGRAPSNSISSSRSRGDSIGPPTPKTPDDPAHPRRSSLLTLSDADPFAARVVSLHSPSDPNRLSAFSNSSSAHDAKSNESANRVSYASSSSQSFRMGGELSPHSIVSPISEAGSSSSYMKLSHKLSGPSLRRKDELWLNNLGGDPNRLSEPDPPPRPRPAMRARGMTDGGIERSSFLRSDPFLTPSPKQPSNSLARQASLSRSRPTPPPNQELPLPPSPANDRALGGNSAGSASSTSLTFSAEFSPINPRAKGKLQAYEPSPKSQVYDPIPKPTDSGWEPDTRHRTLKKSISHQSLSKQRSPSYSAAPLPEISQKGPRKQRSFTQHRLPVPPVPLQLPLSEQRASDPALSTRKRLFSASSSRRPSQSTLSITDDARSVNTAPEQEIIASASCWIDTDAPPRSPVSTAQEYTPQQIMSPAEMLQVEASVEAAYQRPRTGSIMSASTAMSDFEHEFGLSPVSSFGGGRKRSSSDHPSIRSAATSELDMFSIAPQPPSPPILMSLPPPPRRTKSRTSSLSRSQSELVTTLSPPPRRALRPKISVEGRMHRQSIMRKPSFLDIDDEYDKELDPPPHPKSMPRQASFLDLTRDSFDSSRSVDLDSLDYN